MSHLRPITVASSRFEAARHVDSLPEGHRSRALHGHGFVATVFAQLPDGFSSFPGAEVAELQRLLGRCCASLDYSQLNDTIACPTDENIARWIRSRMGIPGIGRLAVQSTPHHGVDLDGSDHAHVWRRYRFQAAHRLPHVPVGHKCGRMHGHNFQVIIHANQSLGTRDLSIDYDSIDAMWEPIADLLDFRCLNEIDGLQNPTSEHLSRWVWDRLKGRLPRLSWVSVYETAFCGANYDGKNFRIWKDVTLDSATRFPRAPTDERCARLHGHTYTLRLHLHAALDELMGWTVDFGDVKTIFDPIFKKLDHHPLYEIDGLEGGSTGAMARWILDAARPMLPQLARVDLFETEGCGSILGEDLTFPAMPI